MKLRYASGEEICVGDVIEYFHEPGEVEFIADLDQPGAESNWYVQEFGFGVMVKEPKAFGHVFISDTEEDTNLVFVSRRNGA